MNPGALTFGIAMAVFLSKITEPSDSSLINFVFSEGKYLFRYLPHHMRLMHRNIFTIYYIRVNVFVLNARVIPKK